MKKINNIILSFLMIFSSIISFFPLTTVEAAGTSYTYAYINDTYVMTRSCASTSCDPVRHDEGGIIYLHYPRVVEVTGYSGDFAKVSYNYWGFSYTGYIYKQYLSGTKTVTLDTNYQNTLKTKGFPDSYVVKLSKMHAIHPNWNFEPSNTGVTLSYAVDQEYNPIYKNLISTTNKNQLSTDAAAYSNGSYIEFEPGWYAPSKQTLNYYLDARNFLDDNSIFMFEQLSYNSNQTETVVQSILNGTFMAGSYSYNNTTWTYAKTFVEAGKKYGISPVHLAARVIQEQGSGGSSTSAMSSDGKTYYNYFNFNASGSTTSEIVANALSYAKRYGWDNPYKAIMGGAEDISDGYITNNQDTLFYQKFNLVGYSSKYWNQYMANIQAPYTEGYSEYSSYFKSSLVNSSFTFKIPVYTDMPITTTIAVKSNNNNLSALSVSNASLSPAFDSSITTYNASVEYDVSSVTVNATKSDSKASVSGTGNKTLSVGANKIEVVVTAEDGSKKTYTITITRKEEEKVDMTETPAEVIKNIGLTNNDNNLSGFTLGKDVSTYINSIKAKYPKAIVKMYNSSNQEITSGLISTAQRLKVTANGTTYFNVVVRGDINGDGKISAIDYSKVKAHILNTSKLSGAYSLAADTSKDGKISAIDYSKVKAHILNISKLAQ